MGKRKSKARVMKKARSSVDTVFDCPFCAHKQTVECKMNFNTNLGNIKCRVCAVTFQCDIHHLSDPIDVYSDWIDSCESINKQTAKDRSTVQREDEEAEDAAEEAED